MTTTRSRRKKLIIGNWKLYIDTPEKARKLIAEVKKAAAKAQKATVVVCPPQLFAVEVESKTKKSKVAVGLQNVSHSEALAQTGEITAEVARKNGIKFVIVGHSERRVHEQEFGETDELVLEKVKLALQAKLTPVVCVGEHRRDDHGMFFGLLKKQLLGSLRKLNRADIEKLVIAYEPVWAIGKSQALDTNDIHQMMLYVKKVLLEQFGDELQIPPILYGGSVNEQSAAEILEKGEVDGLLIGRASADAKVFAQILSCLN